VDEIKIVLDDGVEYLIGPRSEDMPGCCGEGNERGYYCTLAPHHSHTEHIAGGSCDNGRSRIYARWPVAALRRSENPPAVTSEQRIATLEAALRDTLSAMRAVINIGCRSHMPRAVEEQWFKALEAGDVALRLSDG
jgi:hypothetical protein